LDLSKGSFNEQEESQHIHRFDCPRTAYVDHLGVSAVDFTLSDKEKMELAESGKKSVRVYIERAKLGFIGEGENYPPRFIKK